MNKHPKEYAASIVEGSPNTSIVLLLKKYGVPVPLDFVASSLGRRTSEIRDYVRELEGAGVIQLEGDKVKLAAGSHTAAKAGS